MARDDTARNCDTDSSLLNRRKYLKLAGSAVAAGASFGAGNAAASDYETITVSSGESREINLSDGDSLENTLIDITASGAGLRISATGDGWTIRNVGVKGQHSGEGGSTIFTRGTGTIENVYLGDGDRGKDNGAEVSGIFVDRNHSGEITIDRLNARDWSDNGVYGSAPGNPDSHKRPGGGGLVKITNSFSARCGSACFRIGTSGSFVRNCVAVDGYDRGFWGYYNETTFENCDATGNSVQFCAGNSGSSAEENAEIVLENCRAQGNMTWGACVGGINGEVGSDPRTSPPSGVPKSAEEAASGTSSSNSGGSDDGSSSDQSDQSDGTLLELVSDTNVSNVTYEFTVEGSVRKRTSGPKPVAEGNDSITDNGDGSVTVSGEAGNGYGDAYYVDGTMLSTQIDESNWTVRYGGEEVSVGDLTGPTVDRFEVSKSDTLGDECMFSVKWAASNDGADLDHVEVTVANGASDVNFSVTEVSGASASGWDLFQFPTDRSLDVNVRVEDADGTATKKSKNITL